MGSRCSCRSELCLRTPASWLGAAVDHRGELDHGLAAAPAGQRGRQRLLVQRGRTLIRTSGGSRTEQPMPADDAVLAAYRDEFGIILAQVPSAPGA